MEDVEEPKMAAEANESQVSIEAVVEPEVAIPCPVVEQDETSQGVYPDTRYQKSPSQKVNIRSSKTCVIEIQY